MQRTIACRARKPAIVRGENHNRVFVQLHFFQFGSDTPDSRINRFGHRCVCRVKIAARLFFLGFVFFLDLLVGQQRDVNVIVGQVQQERLVLMLTHELNPGIGQLLGSVPVAIVISR